MVGEAEEIVTNPNRSLTEFGHLLHECWKVKRTLTGSITNSSLDEIYEAGRSAGALGGKILGAGGGGFMLFFVPPERRKELRTRLKNLLCVPFGFSNRGSHVVVYEPEEIGTNPLLNGCEARHRSHRKACFQQSQIRRAEARNIVILSHSAF